ncbi:MAG: polysaccharide biosynthesis C-terminal domain-containing protein [Nitrospiraceae bacterium]|nr:polysaccharide biosynthesis C-terminal domain-containing protein [Nitrospiraceae bacterium]
MSRYLEMSLGRKFISGLRSRPLVWDTITTTVFSTLGKGAGFLIPFLIAAWFGISSSTDAFFFAYGIILFLSGVFAPVVESIIVPYIAEARSKNEDVGAFIGNVLGISGAGFLALSAFLLAIAKPALSVMTRFDPGTQGLIYRILLEVAPLIVLMVWSSLLAGSLNAYKKFALPALSPGFRAVIAILAILALKGGFGVQAIAFGYLAGEAVRLAVLLYFIRRKAIFKLRLSFRLAPSMREFLKTASFQAVGMAVFGISPLIDKTMASWLGKGSVSALYYADRLYMVPAAFVESGLMVSVLSHWSQRYHESGPHQLAADMKKTVKIVGAGSLLITLFLVLLHRPIVNIALNRGAFDPAWLSQVGLVWVCLLLGFVPYMLGSIYVRGHIVLKNTNVMMRGAFYVSFLNVILNYLLMRPFGVAGIALSTSICYAFSYAYVLTKFRKETALSGGLVAGNPTAKDQAGI